MFDRPLQRSWMNVMNDNYVSVVEWTLRMLYIYHMLNVCTKVCRDEWTNGMCRRHVGRMTHSANVSSVEWGHSTNESFAEWLIREMVYITGLNRRMSQKRLLSLFWTLSRRPSFTRPLGTRKKGSYVQKGSPSNRLHAFHESRSIFKVRSTWYNDELRPGLGVFD